MVGGDHGEEDIGGLSKRKGFLPEESFQSWSNYTNAWKQVGHRLKDRVLTRSLDTIELNEVKGRSGNEMKKTLNWWELMCMGVGAVIGAGIFVTTGEQTRLVAGPAVIVSYAVAGISAILSVICYTEFAIEIPVAGGSFAYLRVELGDFVAFIAGGNILLQYIISGAGVARSWTSYLATLCNHNPDDFIFTVPGLTKGYNKLDPIAVGVIIVICVIACWNTKSASWINTTGSVIHGAIILFIIIAGLTHANTANIKHFAPFGVQGIFQAAPILFFAYTGFDAVSTMAEETKNPGRDIPIGLIGSMLITITVYCVLAVTLCLMQPYTTVDRHAPFSMAFQQAGMSWAKYIVAAGALKGMTSVLLMGGIGQARYLTHIARTHMVTPWLSSVDEKTGTPIRATFIMMAATAVLALFTDLDILMGLYSVSTLFVFTLVAIALLTRRYYVSGETSTVNRNKFIACLVTIILSSTATAVYWATQEGKWHGYCVTVPIWFLATTALNFIPKARPPKLWGVPLVPWVPSFSIAMNFFLIGSIDWKSFVRFLVWSGILLVYYFFIGLHAAYDTAMEAKEARLSNAKLGEAEEGKLAEPLTI